MSPGVTHGPAVMHGANSSARPANDKEYRRSLTDWNTFVETLMGKVIAADPTIPELPLRDVVFRM